MKSGWETKRLEDLIQLISGQHIDACDYNTDSRGIGYLTGPSDFGQTNPLVSKWTEHPKVGRGKSKHRPRNAPHLYGGQYPFIQTGDIRGANHVITEYSQTYSESGLAQSALWPKGTICITIAANIAETAILGFDACFPDSVIGVVQDPKLADIGFLEFLLQSFKARLQSLGKGSAQANINMGTFEHERFPFPSLAEQRQIVTSLDSLSEESTALASTYKRKITALDELKKSLLHEAFSGRL